jgi:hypothetical protein
MSIEKATNQFGIDFPAAYSKAVWINLNGHSGTFTAEVTVKTWKDKAAKEGVKTLTKDEEGNEVETVTPVDPIKVENIVLTPSKEIMDQIRALIYQAMHADKRFEGGKAV